MDIRPIAARLSQYLSVGAWLGTAVAVGWLAYSYGVPEDLSATGRWYGRAIAVAFYGRVFTFHTGLALVAAAAVGWVTRRRRLLAVAGVAALACLVPAGYACRPRTPPMVVGPVLRVMAINLLFERPGVAGVLDAVRTADPDVIAMEEYADPLDRQLRPALAAAYPYQCLAPRRAAEGLAIYSKRPFVGPPQEAVTGVREQLRVVVRLGDRPVAVYAVHPAAPLRAQWILTNRHQTLDYVDQVAAEPGPAILAGDFNFTAETANAAALARAGLADAFDLAGRGRGSTWPVLPRWRAWLPGVRIDHVYLSPGLTCTRYATGGYDGSDHLPIVADVAVAAR